MLLFGSHSRDDLRGGDIDLPVELPEAGADTLAGVLHTGAPASAPAPALA